MVARQLTVHTISTQAPVNTVDMETHTHTRVDLCWFLLNPCVVSSQLTVPKCARENFEPTTHLHQSYSGKPSVIRADTFLGVFESA